MQKTIFLFLFAALVNPLSAETLVVEEVAPSQKVEKPKTEMSDSKAIQPRAEGGRWSYISAYFDEGKQVPGGSSREEVIKVKEIAGEACYQIKLTVDWRSLMDRLSGAKLSEDDYSYYWEYYNEKGSYNYTSEDRNDVPQDLKSFHLTLPFPVKEGDTYKADDADWEVIDVAAKVSVKAGEFSCIVYQTIFVDEEFPEEASRERYYMAPGVGLVRWEMDFKVDGKWILDARDDLLEYKLDEAPVAKTKKAE